MISSHSICEAVKSVDVQIDDVASVTDTQQRKLVKDDAQNAVERVRI